MHSFRPVSRAMVSTSTLAIILLIGPGPVSAATTLTYDPDTATPGTKVTIYNACLGVTDNPPDELLVAFTSSPTDLPPTDRSVPKAIAKATAGTSLYVVVVPEVKPGLYQILLECLPGDWRTNTAEGGTFPLKILSGAPDTSTNSDVGTRQPPGNRLEGFLLLGLGMVGWIVGLRRLTRRRTQKG